MDCKCSYNLKRSRITFKNVELNEATNTPKHTLTHIRSRTKQTSRNRCHICEIKSSTQTQQLPTHILVTPVLHQQTIQITKQRSKHFSHTQFQDRNFREMKKKHQQQNIFKYNKKRRTKFSSTYVYFFCVFTGEYFDFRKN